MGNGDNRKSMKMRRKKAWRAKKLRVRKKIEAGGAKVAAPKAAPKKRPAGTTTTRKASAAQPAT
ncbi:MAG: hypothetical protein RIQ81_926 [Pseudomonadota bacterium]